MASFLHEMEEIIKANGERGLEQLLYYRGMELDLYRQVTRDDAYGRIHNKNSGNPVECIARFQGAIAGDDFFTNTKSQSGTFKTAYLFCNRTDLREGDEVRIVRDDGRRLAYRVEQSETIGETTQIFTKWKLSGIM